MKIESIKKRKNLYQITLSDKTSLSFYDDTIIKYNLLKPRNITNIELKEMIAYNNIITAYNIALKYINAKLRTKKEIINKLKDYDKKTVDIVIKKLEDNNYLNDLLYIKCFVADQIVLTLNGPKKITNSLIKLGFKESDITNELNYYEDSTWSDKVIKLINKKIKSNHNLSNKMLQNKIKKDLINLGYSKNIIESNLSNIEIKEDLDILQKEYNKVYKRLSRKYEGINLNNKIKYSLYQKGFSIDSINKILDNN